MQLRRFWLLVMLVLLSEALPIQAAPTIISTLGPLSGNALVCYCTGCSSINCASVHGNVLQGWQSCLSLGPGAHVLGTVRLVSSSRLLGCPICCSNPLCAKVTAICGVAKTTCCVHHYPFYTGHNACTICQSVCNEVHAARTTFEGLSVTCHTTTCLVLHGGAVETLHGTGGGGTQVLNVTDISLCDACLFLCGGPGCQFIIVDTGGTRCDFSVTDANVLVEGGLTPSDVLFCVEGSTINGSCPVINDANFFGILITCGVNNNHFCLGDATFTGEVIGSGTQITHANLFGVTPAFTAAPEIDPKSPSPVLALVLSVVVVVESRRPRRT